MTTPGDRLREAETPGTFLHDVAARQFRDHARLGDGCWEWAGPVAVVGYGAIRMGQRGDRTQVYAHRLSYVIHRGPIGEGQLVLHSCDNRLCVNPTHLRLGSISDNMRDKFLRGRCHGKLTAAQRDEAASRIARGELTPADAEREYGLQSGNAKKLMKRRRAAGLL